MSIKIKHLKEVIIDSDFEYPIYSKEEFETEDIFTRIENDRTLSIKIQKYSFFKASYKFEVSSFSRDETTPLPEHYIQNICSKLEFDEVFDFVKLQMIGYFVKINPKTNERTKTL